MPRERAAATNWLSMTFAPLSNSVFRNIWLAGSASNMGSIIQATAAAWLMTTLTTSPMLIAMVQTAATVPMVLFALAAGASADLFDKRKQMLFANLLSLICVIILVILTVQEEITPVRLLLLTAMMSVAMIASAPAWQASVIEIVSRPMLAASISLNGVVFNLARALGPAFAAELIAFAGVAAAFGVNAISFLVMIAVLLFMKHRSAKKTLPPEALGRAMIDGLRFVSLSPGLRLHIARGFGLSLFGSAMLALPPVIAIEMNLGARGFGTLLTSFGLGAMLGALTVAWARTVVKPRFQLGVAMTVLGFGSIALGQSGSLHLASIALFFCGAAWTQGAATVQVAVQLGCPRWVTGRTISIFSTVFALGIAIGAALWGYVATQASVGFALLLSGCGFLVAALISTLSPFDTPEEDGLQPRVDMQAANLPKIHPRAGPVWLSVEYRVPKANVAQFRVLMREYARIRRRDGARSWTLSQDIDERDLWIERFQSPTWSDYLHRISRMMVSDDPLRKQIWELSEAPPKWNRRLERSGSALVLSDDPSDDIEETFPVTGSAI